MAGINLTEAISAFNQILESNSGYSRLESSAQLIVQILAIKYAFISQAARFEPKAITPNIAKNASLFNPEIVNDALKLNIQMGSDAGPNIDIVFQIADRFNDEFPISKPRPIYEPQKPRVRPSEESFNERAKKNIKSGEKPLPGTQPDSPKEDWSGDWS